MDRVNPKKVVGVLGVVALILGVTIFCIIKKEKPVQKPVVPEQASERAKVTLEKVWEKKFDKKIKGMAWEKGKGGLVITDDEIISLDERGEEISRQNIFKYKIPYGEKGWQAVEAGSSENKEYIGVSTVEEETKNGERLRREKFVLLNRAGKKLWEIDKVPSAGSFAFAISNEGRVAKLIHIGEEGGQGTIDFYNEEGKIIKKARYFDKYHGTISVWSIGKFSGDGEYLIVLGGDGSEIKRCLVLYDKEGKELWKKVVDWPVAYWKMDISKNGNFIVTNKHIHSEEKSNSYISVFNKEGKLLWEHELRRSGAFTFSEDENYLINTETNRLCLFEAKSGKLLWDFFAEKENIHFSSVDISANNRFIVAGAFTRDKYNNATKQRYIYLLDRNGTKIWQQAYEVVDTMGSVRIKISPEGKYIRVLIPEDKKMLTYSITGE